MHIRICLNCSRHPVRYPAQQKGLHQGPFSLWQIEVVGCIVVFMEHTIQRASFLCLTISRKENPPARHTHTHIHLHSYSHAMCKKKRKKQKKRVCVCEEKQSVAIRSSIIIEQRDLRYISIRVACIFHIHIHWY